MANKAINIAALPRNATILLRCHATTTKTSGGLGRRTKVRQNASSNPIGSNPWMGDSRPGEVALEPTYNSIPNLAPFTKRRKIDVSRLGME